jgi:hypothetical protein
MTAIVERLASRRQVLAGAAGAVGLLSGLTADRAHADTQPPSDSELLTKTLDVERLMVLAYERVLGSGALSPGFQRVIAPFLGQERAHVSAIAAALARLGAPVPTAPLSLGQASDLLGQHSVSESLTGLHSQDACLKLLVDLESVAEGAAYTPIKDLQDPALVHLFAQIMACEAQHWTVLSGLRNPGQYIKAVPWPYVFGSK